MRYEQALSVLISETRSVRHHVAQFQERVLCAVAVEKRLPVFSPESRQLFDEGIASKQAESELCDFAPRAESGTLQQVD
jgi:hypothetical protein